MFRQVISLLLLCIGTTAYSQIQFYGGYGIGHYASKESAPEIMATKFNLGWDFSVNSDGCLIFFLPGSDTYKIDNFMNWANAPHGMNLGAIIPFSENFGMQLGLDWLNMKGSGKRTRLSDQVEEKFSLKTRYAGFALNFIFLKSKLIQPYLGFDMGTTTFRFWYDDGTTSYKNERLGYNVKLGGTVKPGDKALTIGANLGCFIKIAQFQSLSLALQPNLQYRVKGTSDIFCGDYAPYLFNHSNVSLSFVAKYTIE